MLQRGFRTRHFPTGACDRNQLGKLYVNNKLPTNVAIRLTPILMFSVLCHITYNKHIQFSLTHFHAIFPRKPKMSSGQKASDRMPGQMVYPSFLSQLRHYSIYPWESRFTNCPLRQCLWVFIPGYLNANWIANHSVKVWGFSGSRVKEFPPQKLTIQ